MYNRFAFHWSHTHTRVRLKFCHLTFWESAVGIDFPGRERVQEIYRPRAPDWTARRHNFALNLFWFAAHGHTANGRLHVCAVTRPSQEKASAASLLCLLNQKHPHRKEFQCCIPLYKVKTNAGDWYRQQRPCLVDTFFKEMKVHLTRRKYFKF